MEQTSDTNESTYEITFRFKSMKEMNKFTIEYDDWRDDIAKEEIRRENYNREKREKRRAKDSKNI